MSRVLIVDDDPDIRQSVRTLLEDLADDQAYAVADAANGQEALDHLRADAAPTVVVFDVAMPVMDGEQFLREALADSCLAARCAFICFPATLSHITPEFAEALRVHGILVVGKPFDIDTLLDAIRQAAVQLPAASG